MTKLQDNVELQAVRGYPYCQVNDSTYLHLSNAHQCDFENLPQSNGTLLVTFVNSAWIQLAQNWICSAAKVGLLDRALLISFEKGVCKNLTIASCYEYPNTSISGAIFGRSEYRRLVIKRTEAVLKLLACGCDLILVDADIVFLQNPLHILHKLRSGKDILFQADSIRVSFVDPILPYFFHYICGGFVYMKSNAATKYLWMSVLQFQKHFFWNDQAGLNVCIRHHSQRVVWSTLNSDQFPNGQQFFVYQQKSSKNIIVHANHMTGMEKIMRMMASGIWCSKSSAVAICKDQSYKDKCLSYIALPHWCGKFFRVCRWQYNVR